jgi:cell division protein FtsA
MANSTTLVIDIGSSNIDAVIAKKANNGIIEILGSGISKSAGIHKGSITNIELLGLAIKKAVTSANRTSDEDIHSATVSISGAYTRTIRGSGSISIPTGYISESEIKNVLEVAYHNSSMIPEYEVIHILPIYFKIDDIQSDAPLNMTGSRLEVSVVIIVAKKSALVNIENALKPSGLEVENFVLSGYASSISTLNNDERNFGTLIIDMGASTINMTLCHNGSVLFNDFLSFGSQYITNDISQTFNTPILAAEMIKNQYATLKAYKEDDTILQKRIKVPILGNEEDTNEITLDRIQAVVHARVEEILIMTYNKFMQSELDHKIKAGVVLTGGMSKLSGIKELAQQVFKEFNVKVGTVTNIHNEYIDFNDNAKSTTVGLILFALNNRDSYELDSKKQLKLSTKSSNIIDDVIDYAKVEVKEIIEEPKIQEDTIVQKEELLQVLEKDKKESFLSRTLSSMKDWF